MRVSEDNARSTGALTMGHVALHYGKPDEGPLAAKLLERLGFVKTQDLPLPGGGHFYRFVVNPEHEARGDGILYLSPVPPAQAALVEAVRSALKIGAPGEHPAVAGMRAALEVDPEYSFHVGVLLDSLEELERIVQAVRSDAELAGRLKVTLNRARPGDPQVDARLDASPIYAEVDRYAYGANGVQAFIETDILTSGTLGESMVLELDYVFPGYRSHILSVVEM